MVHDANGAGVMLPALPEVIVKITARCNLDCTYCYVYNMGDDSWRSRPRVMSDAVFEATVERMRRHAARAGQGQVRLILHGGEPCLAGPGRVDRWLTRAYEACGNDLDLRVALQTNGTLLDDDWVEVIHRHRISVGISLDGPPEIHDGARIDHAGRGSYERVVSGLRLLQAAGIDVGVITVLQLSADSRLIHRHLVNLGFTSISYLAPDVTWSSVGLVRAGYGPVPVADYLIGAFDEWWPDQALSIRVRQFDEAIAGLRSGSGTKLRHFAYVAVQTEGGIVGDDVLGIVESDDRDTELTVLDHDFADLAGTSRMDGQAVFDGSPLPTACGNCEFAGGCGGGQLVHRWSRERGFDNPKAWCADQLIFLAYVRRRLGSLASPGRSAALGSAE